jgi:hypothetical protein
MSEQGGGRKRELTAEPKYTEQIVFLATPDQADRLVEIARALGVSKAEVGRRALTLALPRLEAEVKRQRMSETLSETLESSANDV